MSLKNRFLRKTQETVTIAPLLTYRILFGGMLIYAWFWSILKDDINVRFIEPSFFFKYYGLGWIGFVGEQGIYVVYALWLLGAIGVFLGFFYRLAIWSLFFSFSYLHFLDATNYINHYYAISIFAFLLGFLPANAGFSIDVWRKPEIEKDKIPRGYILAFQFQVTLIYLFAAISKINSDWLLEAMPLKIWLLQNIDFPLLGKLFEYNTAHFLFSWFGFLFDLTIVGFLIWRKSRGVAYCFVLLFHIMTGVLLSIGLFPILMILTTTLFFSPNRHLRILEKLAYKRKRKISSTVVFPKPLLIFFLVHFVIQIFLPLRHWVLYTGNPTWTEEGARFSWRVMLAEKDGVATFFVEDPNSKQKWTVENLDFLTPFQEKRMAVRPNHILQYAHYLAKVYSKRYAIEKPIVRAEVDVTLNGRVSQKLIDSNVNLAEKEISIWQQDWILPFKKDH